MDVVATFLNGEVDQNVYMEVSQHVTGAERSHNIFKLVIQLYRLRALEDRM